MGNALHKPALGLRIPKLHGTRRAGKGAGLADAEQESHDHERGRVERAGGHRGHDRPIGDDAG